MGGAGPVGYVSEPSDPWLVITQPNTKPGLLSPKTRITSLYSPISPPLAGAVGVRYRTLEFDGMDIHLCSLRDNQQFHDADGAALENGITSAEWPLFGLLWEAGGALARHMLTYPIEHLRILEVGCGLGLASLILKRRNGDITATDRHPESQRFLAYNTWLNQGQDIPFVRSDWEAPDTTMGRFDLIVGSDLLYQREHPRLLASFLEQHARPSCTVIIADAQRGHLGQFCKQMAGHGFTHTRSRCPGGTFQGWLLHCAR